jgi:propanol-preferring alcohol dehydrogenase
MLLDVAKPKPDAGQLLVCLSACAVCRTDLHIVDGELPDPKLPLIPGHQIVGHVEQVGTGIEKFSIGDRVGIPWLGWTDGECVYCRSNRENLCDRARFTGYTIDGGYAEFVVADARFCFHLPEQYNDVDVAPLLCAGMLGYRSYRKRRCPSARHLRFRNAAHLIAQVAIYQGREVFAFTRPGDKAGQESAEKIRGELGPAAPMNGPPEKLNAAIIFASVGELNSSSTTHTCKRRRRGSGGIHMSDIPSFPYVDLWGERAITSVANLTRRDAQEFPRDRATGSRSNEDGGPFPLEEAYAALDRFRAGQLEATSRVVI